MVLLGASPKQDLSRIDTVLIESPLPFEGRGVKSLALAQRESDSPAETEPSVSIVQRQLMKCALRRAAMRDQGGCHKMAYVVMVR